MKPGDLVKLSALGRRRVFNSTFDEQEEKIRLKSLGIFTKKTRASGYVVFWFDNVLRKAEEGIGYYRKELIKVVVCERS